MTIFNCLQVQPFNINITEHGWKTCNRGDEWGTYKDVVNCNTCRVPGLRVTKESIWGFFETRAPEDREGLPLERTQKAGARYYHAVLLCQKLPWRQVLLTGLTCRCYASSKLAM